MFGLDTLDVAIGLVFVYLMVSFVCSAAVELVEVFLKARPRKLLEGIRELLKSDNTFVKMIYDDPLVNALFKGEFEKADPTKLPSYIPARNFALAVLNQLPDGQGDTAWTRLSDAIEKFKATPLPGVSADAQAHIYTTLKSALLTAKGDVNAVVKNIEDWYNSAMDRVSGWFKRRTQYILLGFGLACAIGFNIDTIYVVQRLTYDKALRAAVVASAGAAVTEAPPATGSTPPATSSAGTTTTGTTTTGTTTTGTTTTGTTTTGTTTTATTTGEAPKPTPEDVKKAEDRLTKSITQLQKAGLPIGWNANTDNQNKVQMPFGWLLTGIAVSFGAPFWFDVLNKFMVVRSTVKPKEKSGPEKSKDA